MFWNKYKKENEYLRGKVEKAEKEKAEKEHSRQFVIEQHLTPPEGVEAVKRHPFKNPYFIGGGGTGIIATLIYFLIELIKNNNG